MNFSQLYWWYSSETNTLPIDEIGLIVNDDFARGSLGADYDASTMVNAPVLTGSKMTLTGVNAGIAAQRIEYNYVNSFDQWTMYIRCKLTGAKATGTHGLGIGTSLVESVGYGNRDVVARHRMSTAGTDNNLSTIRGGDGAINRNDTTYDILVQSTAMTIAQNDEYSMELKREWAVGGGKYTFTVTNITNPASRQVTWEEDLSQTVGGYFMHRAVKPTIYFMGGDYDVYEFSFSVQSKKNMPYLIVGDSITHGLFADNKASRWADQVANFLGNETQTHAGGGMGTVHLSRLQDVIVQSNPDNVILFIGTNDINIGNANRQTEYENFVNHLKGQGINVIHLLCLPRASHPLAVPVWNSWIQTTFSSDTIIDVNTPLNDGADALDALYDSGDGLHPSQAGHDLIASTVISQL